MPKKTLNEATVRQFMKLVNHKPATISNFISEQYKEEKELEETTEVLMLRAKVTAKRRWKKASTKRKRLWKKWRNAPVAEEGRRC